MKYKSNDMKGLVDKMRDVIQQDLNDLAKVSDFTVAFGVPKGTNKEGQSIEEYARVNHDGSFSQNIPARPFLSTVRRRYSEKISADTKRALEELKGEKFSQGTLKNSDVKRVMMKNVALPLENYAKDNVISGSWVQNAPSTVSKKGSSKPLVDQGEMVGSINAIVVKR